MVGIDPSESVIAYARNVSPPNATFQIAGGETIPAPDASFDTVISSLAVHHIAPALRPVTLREMHRVLRPGGTLLIADFRPPRNPALAHLVGALSGHAMQHNPIGQLAGLISGAGFEITGSGDLWPLLHYIRASTPGAALRQGTD